MQRREKVVACVLHKLAGSSGGELFLFLPTVGPLAPRLSYFNFLSKHELVSPPFYRDSENPTATYA